MSLASDVGGLVVLGVGVKMIGKSLDKSGRKLKKGMKGWKGESERHQLARYGIKSGKKNTYEVSWGTSVYYPHQFEKPYYHKKKIVGAKPALAYLKKVNARKSTDFSDIQKVK